MDPRLGEHSAAEVDARKPPRAHRPQVSHCGAGSAADIESRVDLTDLGDRWRQYLVRCPERRGVEFRRKEIVAALRGTERLVQQLEERRAVFSKQDDLAPRSEEHTSELQ